MVDENNDDGREIVPENWLATLINGYIRDSQQAVTALERSWQSR